ncbi:GNAT family N-acetyltransferase [Streptomyces sp. DSM 41527]|uniref:GNAT family N-acetyltransferase n=1 Tax=Streptomyces mooreae TaxID=3075523 RepID=A0ABU2TDY2_9ACTN|nr:GNAT family N-acetyltransferase [Streptomyces sp. DSM 41527]MDT0459153.1 GNAT family N-acetyltransferase [Streptomyces sp. DSM 41527]
MHVRRASVEDSPALARARASLIGETPTGPWLNTLEQHIATEISDRRMAAFLIDAHHGDHVVSCALGTIQQGLPGPGYDGQYGYVHLVWTLSEYRCRGYGRAVTTALLRWLEEQGCPLVTLNTSTAAADLYLSLGFTPNDKAMRWVRRRAKV